MSTTKIFGVRVDVGSRSKTFETAIAYLHGNQSGLIATPNAEMLLLARKNKLFRDVLNSAVLSLPDSMGVVWALRIAGHPTQRIAGVDFAEDLIAHAAEHHEKLALVGGASGCAQDAAEKLIKKYSGLKVRAEPHTDFLVTQHGEPQNIQEEHELIERLVTFAPQILLVALGAPKQELWIKRVLPQLPSVRIAMGIGGGMDYWAGKVPRAPQTMRNIGLEWLWRAVLEPWRLPRILNATVVFPALLLAEKVKGTD